MAKRKNPDLLRTRAEQQRCQVVLCTLILRGPSRRARLLLGVSMLMTLSRPRSREPKTFPPRFFFPLSSVTARSRDRDLRTSGHMVTSSSKYDTTACLHEGNSPPLRTEGQNSNVRNLLVLDRCPLIVIFRAAVYT